MVIWTHVPDEVEAVVVTGGELGGEFHTLDHGATGYGCVAFQCSDHHQGNHRRYRKHDSFPGAIPRQPFELNENPSRRISQLDSAHSSYCPGFSLRPYSLLISS